VINIDGGVKKKMNSVSKQRQRDSGVVVEEKRAVFCV
jgi:hypothetical protein